MHWTALSIPKPDLSSCWTVALGLQYQLQLTDGKSALIYCQNDHTQSQTLAVEIQASALSTNDNAWEHHLLEEQIIWWFTYFKNYVVFSDME